MKPMIVVVIFGLALFGIMLYFGSSSFEGTVEDKTYEAAQIYDTTKADIKSVENAITDIKGEREDNRVTVKFTLNPAASDYGDVKVLRVQLIRPIGKNIELKEEGGSYEGQVSLGAGWYNLRLTLNADKKIITVDKSFYLN